MAWTLLNYLLQQIDVWPLLLSSLKAGAVAAAGYILKRVWGKMVGASKCTTPKCYHSVSPTVQTYGLCVQCFNRAELKVELGETTWEKLAQMGLCIYPKQTDPFDDAYSKAMEDH